MKLLIACDGQDTASLFGLLAPLVTPTVGEVLLVHVIDPESGEEWARMGHTHVRGFSRHHAELGQQVTEADQAHASAVLAEAERLAQATFAGAVSRPLVLHGRPEWELIRLANAERPALLVIQHHRPEVGPRAMGRCARYVLDHAACPVLALRDTKTTHAHTPPGRPR